MKLRWLSLAPVSLGLGACANFPLPPVAAPMATGSTYAGFAIGSSGSGYGLPAAPITHLTPPAVPGECFVRVQQPAVEETVAERVLVKAASSRVEVVAARYESASERLLVKPASKRLEVIPATFETVTERVQVKAAAIQLEVVPATFEAVTERLVVRPESRRLEEVPEVVGTEIDRVLVKPASTVWKRSSELSAIERAARGIAADADDVLCLVEVPAEYREVSRSVVKTPATVREIVIPAEYSMLTRTVQRTPASTLETEIPAEYADVAKTVVKTPARTREIEVPAEYSTVATQRLVVPATTRTIEVPAEYGTVTKTVLRSAEKPEWRQVICETHLTSVRLRAIQAAITRAGFNTGRVDGIVDNATMDAVRRFQRARNLPVDNDRYINVATVRALGLSER